MLSKEKINAFFKSFAAAEEKLDVQIASERLNIKLPAISTGSILLDDILGCGGYPCGRIIQLYGPPSSGKSLMSMLAIKEAQKIDLESRQLFIDAENTFNVGWADKLGLDTDRIILIDEDLAVNGRKCFEMLLGEPRETKGHVLDGKKKEGLLDKITSKEFNINLIVLDSLGAIIPPIEDVAAIGKNNMSPMARFLTTTFKKLSLEVSKANIPFIVVNHKRDNLDIYASADHTFSGGNTYAHFLSANIYFEAVMRKDSIILDEKENKIGHPIKATIEKSKFSAFPRKCEFKVNFNIGIIDTHEEIAQLAVDYDIVQKPSTVSYEYKDNKIVGYTKYCDFLKDNKDITDELKQKILEARDLKLNKKKNIPNIEVNIVEEKPIEVNIVKEKPIENNVSEENSKKIRKGKNSA